MPVDIRGKQYKTVAERLTEFSDKHKSNFTLETEVLRLEEPRVETILGGKEDGKDSHIRHSGFVLVKATLTCNEHTWTGHALEREGEGFINKTSHVENAETSAIGRALSSAGYSGSEFASAEEVANAMKQQDKMSRNGEW